MKELEIRLKATGDGIKGHTIDMGEWDIAEGFNQTIYLHNPNSHAKAKLEELKNMDPRVKINYAREIEPLDTISVNISIPPHEYAGEEDEKEFFVDLIDALAGKVKWVRP
jgi:hypothetical protein